MLEKELNGYLEEKFQKTIAECSDEEIYLGLLQLTKNHIKKIR